MKENWKTIPFEKSIEKVKYTTKIPSSDYKRDGKYPVVSQEEGLISGYWNNDEDVFHIQHPIVVFGDHTRILKYIDFDFVLGADGVKILSPVEGLNAKFFCHYLQWYKIPSLGYSRHFKLLKEISVPIPPLPEQESIVKELDLLSGIIEKKKQQLKELDNLAQSIFYEMFGDLLTNPYNFSRLPLKELGELARGVSKHRPRNASELLGGDMPLIQTGDVANAGMYINKFSSTYSELGVAQSRVWEKGTLCITIAANIGKCAILTFKACFPDSVVGFRPNDEKALVSYMYFVFSSLQKLLEDTARGVAQKNINLATLNALMVPTPPLSLQESFAQKIEAIESQKELIKQSIKETETLFNSRMDYYFN